MSLKAHGKESSNMGSFNSDRRGSGGRRHTRSQASFSPVAKKKTVRIGERTGRAIMLVLQGPVKPDAGVQIWIGRNLIDRRSEGSTKCRGGFTT